MTEESFRALTISHELSRAAVSYKTAATHERAANLESARRDIVLTPFGAVGAALSGGCAAKGDDEPSPEPLSTAEFALFSVSLMCQLG